MKKLFVLITISIISFLINNFRVWGEYKNKDFINSNNHYKNYSQSPNTDVGGPIFIDTVWNAENSPYIVTNSIDVLSGVTLIIESGVIVKFNTNKKIIINGIFIAQGTEENPIIFTSNNPNPQSGDWANIEFDELSPSTVFDTNGNYVSGSILKYCVIEYGGNGEYESIRVYSHFIDKCTIRYSSARGISTYGSSSNYAQITNNIISENTGDTGNYFSYTVIQGNSIFSNTVSGGGGGLSADFCIIKNNEIIGNIANESGGGISSAGGFTYENIVENNIIKNNKGNIGGGIHASASYVANNVVENNISISNGGGISAVNQSTIISNTIRGNSANYLAYGGDSGRGGGIYALSNITITENIITNNYAPFYGGGIFSINGLMTPLKKQVRKTAQNLI